MENQYCTVEEALEELRAGRIIISIDDPELAGIYEETGWSLTMAAGQMMQHTAKRTVIA